MAAGTRAGALARRRPAPRRRARRALPFAYYTTAAVLTVLFLFPVVWTALRSLQGPAADAQAPSLRSLTELTLRSYQRLASTGAGMLHYAGNSALVAVGTALGSVVLCTLAGYGFSRLRFPGSGALFVVILTPFMVPFQGILTPLFTVLTWLHLSDNLLGLILVYVTFQLPFGVFIMSNSFAQVPRAIEEAAMVDGLSTMGVLYRVLWRLVMPGIVTVALFAFLFAWNEFLAALILLTSDARFTLPIALNNLQAGSYGRIDFGTLDAGALVAMVPCLLVFLLLQRYYVRGLAAGAVKL
jgi:multiple sugar transport system permease protein